MKTKHEIDSFYGSQKRKRKNDDYLRFFRGCQAQGNPARCL